MLTVLGRDFGILFGFFVVSFIVYLIAAETARPPKSKGEVLVFPSGKIPSLFAKSGAQDTEANPLARETFNEKEESDGSSANLAAGSAVFHWEDLCYDISMKTGKRRLLDCVDGWVKPGTSTALMVSYSTFTYTGIPVFSRHGN